MIWWGKSIVRDEDGFVLVGCFNDGSIEIVVYELLARYAMIDEKHFEIISSTKKKIMSGIQAQG